MSSDDQNNTKNRETYSVWLRVRHEASWAPVAFASIERGPTILSTVILDAYSSDRRAEMAEAIDALCAPDHSGAFGSSGLYGFWDFATRDLLYIGIAGDFGWRFRQHNGLTSCPVKGCKVQQIDAYFETNELLGFTLMPQSPLDSPNTARARREWPDDPEAATSLAELAEPGREEIEHAEGQLLAASVDVTGALPPWNRIGGSKVGQRAATSGHAPILDTFRGRFKSGFTARLALRGLVADDEAARYENLLHAVRWEILAFDGGEMSPAILRAKVEQLAKRPPFMAGPEFAELRDSGYLDGFESH